VLNGAASAGSGGPKILERESGRMTLRRQEHLVVLARQLTP